MSLVVQSNKLNEGGNKMKKLIAGIAVVVAVLGFSGTDAKADSRTLHGVADIIYATGTLVNGSYGYDAYYEPYPVYHRSYYYPYGGYRSYRGYGGYHHYPQYRRYNHCY